MGVDGSGCSIPATRRTSPEGYEPHNVSRPDGVLKLHFFFKKVENLAAISVLTSLSLGKLPLIDSPECHPKVLNVQTLLEMSADPFCLIDCYDQNMTKTIT